MAIRKAQPWDIPTIKEIHKRAGYQFTLPDLEGVPLGFVIEEEGRVAMWVGAELEAQIIMVVDPDWGSPHERMRTFASLHLPVARWLHKLGVRNANVHLDPQFKKFGKRLSQLGWHKALWEHYFMSVKECLDALLKRAG